MMCIHSRRLLSTVFVNNFFTGLMVSLELEAYLPDISLNEMFTLMSPEI